MKYLKDLFFNLTFTGDYVELLIRFFAFIGVTALILFLIYLIFTKFIFAKTDSPRDVQLKLNLLWTLGIFQLVLAVYFFFLLRFQGTSFFKWSDPIFYVGLSPFFLIFLGTIIWYAVKYSSFQKIVQPKKII